MPTGQKLERPSSPQLLYKEPKGTNRSALKNWNDAGKDVHPASSSQRCTFKSFWLRWAAQVILGLAATIPEPPTGLVV